MSDACTIADYCWSIQPKLANLKHQLDALTDQVTPAQASLYEDFFQASGYEFLDSCRYYCDDETLIRITLGQLFFSADLVNVPITFLSEGEHYFGLA